MSRPLTSMTSSPPNATPYSSSTPSSLESHPYIQPESSDSRSPCPALNTLANHGYIQRTGKDISFLELIDALQHVYNLSWLLSLFLAVVGFLTSGKFTFSAPLRDPSRPDTWFTRIRDLVPIPRWTIELGSLSIRGPKKIAHDAAFVHPNYIQSHAPDGRLLTKLLSFASSCNHGPNKCGLSLVDMAHYHKERERELSSPLNKFQQQVALGECGLAWAVMRRRAKSMDRKGSSDSSLSERDDIITVDTIQRWFGCERLPDDWWVDGGSRPIESVGLFEARRRANHVAKISSN
ncbi:hypothetical protein D9756_007906 [Leucocoprinus leucothites]|uniref:Heme haloperoxidase family profile domain-containing protein n=1 Tax=Leucocoprinus leucothites TaxID=201217 RepID=A0A8H5FXI9_9AGAR|nr:hypothetical protein D9756_007906 [Leucoagaricus leucothites]